MHMRRITVLLLAGLMCLSMAGCGSKKTSADTTGETTQEDLVLEEKTFLAEPQYVKQMGRTYMSDKNVLWLIHSLSAVEFKFSGTKASVDLMCDSTAITGSNNNKPRYAIYVNGERVVDGQLKKLYETIDIPLNNGDSTYTVWIVKLSEADQSTMGIQNINVTCRGNIEPTPAKDLKIEFIGDSITCGYGVDDEDENHSFSTQTEDASKAYAYKTAVLMNADYSLVSYSGHGIISGYSGDGNKVTEQLVPDYYTKLGKSYGTGGGIKINEIEWDFSKFVPDIVVINLGTNDASYTKNNKDKMNEYRDAYVDFLKLIREKNPDAYIVCTLGVMGTELCKSMHEAVEAFKSETGDTRVDYMDFAPQAASDGLAADWHPTERTHEKAAQKLAEKLQSIIGEN